jgi:uncharacterized protein (UPF0332 family)
VNEESRRYLRKAQRSLRASAELLAKGYYEDSCSKSYYATFYATQALLKENGINVVKHSAVVSKFGEQFIKTGKIESHFHRHIIDAKQKREIADYDVFLSINRQTAEERLSGAKAFLKEIKRYLSQMEQLGVELKPKKN